MQQGFVAGFATGFYRDTQDGRSVTSRLTLPLFRRRWYYVGPDQRESFERRPLRAYFAGMIAMLIGVRIVLHDVFYVTLSLIALTLVIMPTLQVWTTAGLSAADLTVSPLTPSTYSHQALTQSRAFGERNLWIFFVLGIFLTIPQGFVAVTQGAWWAWMGVVMFGSMTVYFARLIAQLRAEGIVRRAS